jgi:RHS repeat-associated protein
VLNTQSATQSQAFAYTPYGERSPKNGLPSLLGFKGERLDPLTGNYDLGNGYRRYNTWLKRFDSPDSLSPFGEGGLNTYGFVAGDPVNLSDPTGHFPVSKLVIGAFPVGAVSAGIATLLIDDKDWKPVLLGITIGLAAATVALPLILRARPKRLGLNRSNTTGNGLSPNSSPAQIRPVERAKPQLNQIMGRSTLEDIAFRRAIHSLPESAQPPIWNAFHRGLIPTNNQTIGSTSLQFHFPQPPRNSLSNASTLSQSISESASSIRSIS